MNVPENIINKTLYKNVKQDIINRYPKHSAYRSMLINKTYKEKGGKYKEIKGEKKETSIWLKEKWLNLTPYVEGIVKTVKDSPKCGNKHPKQKGPSICRPSVKVNSNTPKLAQDFTKEQIKKAYNIKKKGKRIDWDKL